MWGGPKLASRLDADGNLQVVSSEHRERERNVEAAYSRMTSLIKGALEEPKPRRVTKRTAASNERRLAEKRRRSQTKKRRSDEEE